MPGGDAVLEAERRADGEHPLSGLQARRVAELHDRQVRGVDLDHRDVGALVGADDLGRELAPVGEAHGHLVRVRHHVRVGEDVAVGADDEAGARAAHRLARPRLLVRRRDAEALEEVIEGIVRREPLDTTLGGLRLLHHLDVDHRRPVAVDEAREIRQSAHHPVHHRWRRRGGLAEVRRRRRGRGARGLGGQVARAGAERHRDGHDRQHAPQGRGKTRVKLGMHGTLPVKFANSRQVLRF